VDRHAAEAADDKKVVLPPLPAPSSAKAAALPAPDRSKQGNTGALYLMLVVATLRYLPTFTAHNATRRAAGSTLWPRFVDGRSKDQNPSAVIALGTKQHKKCRSDTRG
jgi:hypothetical protein